MSITVIVRSPAGDETRLTFDGTTRIVIGRGSSCDVRLPDASVSFRHASLRAQGAEFALIDEGSRNGTFVGGVRVAARTSRIVRSGDRVRIGRVWLELRLDQSPVTRDLAAATRDLALGLVAQAMQRAGEDATTKVSVVEGRDQGATLQLSTEGRDYVLGRAAECDLPLSDSDVSRQHLEMRRQGGVVAVRDLDTKNGSWLGEARVPSGSRAVWRPAQMLRVGHTVLALVEPVAEALAAIECAPDEALGQAELASEPPENAAAAPEVSAPQTRGPEGDLSAQSPPKQSPESERGASPVRAGRAAWSVTDVIVVSAAVGVLALSVAGLVWLLRG
jgi:pSer/pThr/pTyr-binding forkhead associated (FHA) protein